MVGHSQVRDKLVNFILFIMVGLVLVGIGGFFWWHDKNLRQECTAQTAGVVIDEGHSIKNKNGRRADKYRPTFAYSVEGVEYTKQTNTEHGARRFSEGQSVTVFYDPSKPQRYYILEEGGPGSLVWIPVILGVLFLLVPPLLKITTALRE